MAYRRITVDGRNYEYVLGRKNLKVKGLGIFSREERNIHSQDRVIEIIREVCIKDKELALRNRQWNMNHQHSK